MPHVLFRLSYVPKMDRDPMSNMILTREFGSSGTHRSSYPDLRHSTCKSGSKNLRDNRKLLSTTVIICFVDEEFNTSLQIYSVLTRSPSDLLDEIILVDDGSTDLRLLNELPLYIERHLPRTRLVRTHARTGLIRARVRGVSEASSPTVTFLDSHVEVSEGWLTPLMERLSDDSTSSHCVSRDYCDPSKHVETASESGHGNTAYGVFDWKMIFH